MTLEELRKEVPELENYLKYMPKELEQRYWIKTYAPGVIIHQKDYELEYFGIIARGEHRVINEFQNGNVFMIEKNEPIDFVGEVTILAGMPKTSVTIETLTETTVFYISRKDFEDWIAKDIHFLRLVAHKIAYKLYRSSYNRGARLFYPPQFILLDYVLRAAAMEKVEKTGHIIIKKTRYKKPISGTELVIELDVFSGTYEGLMLAEVEFPDMEAAEHFVPPAWFGEDVTLSGKYQNSRLSQMR